MVLSRTSFGPKLQIFSGCITTFGHVPIPDITIITLTLAMIEKNKTFGNYHREVSPPPNGRVDCCAIQVRVSTPRQERIRRHTVGNAGFHGAQNATITSTIPTPAEVPAIAAAAVTPASTPAASRHITVVEGGGKMYYCWGTHGLSPMSNPTSLTCLRKAEEDNKDDATGAFKMKGGINTILSGRPRQLAAPAALATNTSS